VLFLNLRLDIAAANLGPKSEAVTSQLLELIS
jgi:hypothetical protein